MTTIQVGERHYGRLQVLAAIATEKNPCTKALAIAALDCGVVDMADLEAHVPQVATTMALWRTEPEVASRLASKASCAQAAHTVPIEELHVLHRGHVYAKSVIIDSLKGTRISAMQKAVVLLAIDRKVVTESEVCAAAKWMSAQLIFEWRNDLDVMAASEAQAPQPKLHDPDADADFGMKAMRA